MKQPPQLRVFCPVDPSQLDATDGGMICRKCHQYLSDVAGREAGENALQSACGVLRRIAIPALGSSLALAGCSTSHLHPEPGQRSDAALETSGETKQKEIPLPGIYYPAAGMDLTPEKYPIAKPGGRPGIVISPYTGSKVDVSNAPQGSLVLDPAYKMADQKYFRVPRTGSE